ncbi:MAG: hypothetical protein O3B96_00230 [bacterium]|nr:hypothetical protein [bacterium]
MLNKHKQSILITIVFLLMIIVVAYIALINPKKGDREWTDRRTQRQHITQSDTGTASNFALIHPSTWEQTERAEASIATLAEDQIMRFAIVADPEDKDRIYFATGTPGGADVKESLLSIYAYRLDDYTWERLFRNTYERGDLELTETGLPTFHVLGVEDRNLVLAISERVLDPESCANPYEFVTGQSAAARFVTMSLDDPYGGFEDYEPSEAARAGWTDYAENCTE